MRWRVRDKEPKMDWHVWFAWRPVVTINGYMAWLERVNRKWKIHMNGGVYQYSLIKQPTEQLKDSE